MKWHLILCGALLIGVLGFWFLGMQASETDTVNDSVTDTELATVEGTSINARLSVQTTPSAETVVVTEAVLTEPGYLVVREVIGDTAGQIVEISPYLAAGTYSNIEISLGSFYSGANELMVLIYEDTGNDKVLNDLDQPFVDADGDFVAQFVATGDVVPNEVIETKPGDISLADMGMNAQIVTYTNDGFTPAAVEVEAGAMVQFVNESDTQMWVASDSHPAHDILPTFDQFKPGDMFMYVFEEPGTWKYHDHLNPSAGGTITVTERSAEGSAVMNLQKNEQGYFATPSDQFSALIAEPDVTVINVHIPYGGEIAGTDVFVPYNDTEALLAALPADKTAPVALYCRSGGMSAVAAQAVVAAGYENVYDLLGGMNAYRDSGREIIDKEN